MCVRVCMCECQKGCKQVEIDHDHSAHRVYLNYETARGNLSVLLLLLLFVVAVVDWNYFGTP